jgi:hypothetical protein
MVDGADVSIVANANPSQIGNPNYNSILDLNFDLIIDNLDVNMVNNCNGESVWTNITLQAVVDNNLAYVYGLTDQFSILGIYR